MPSVQDDILPVTLNLYYSSHIDSYLFIFSTVTSFLLHSVCYQVNGYAIVQAKRIAMAHPRRHLFNIGEEESAPNISSLSQYSLLLYSEFLILVHDYLRET